MLRTDIVKLSTKNMSLLCEVTPPCSPSSLPGASYSTFAASHTKASSANYATGGQRERETKVANNLLSDNLLHMNRLQQRPNF